MRWWFHLVTDLLLTAYAVWLLLTAYRVVGKPPGADEKYDAWYRHWAGSWKLLGWSGVVLMVLNLAVLLWWG
jgi:hypothetical protein